MSMRHGKAWPGLAVIASAALAAVLGLSGTASAQVVRPDHPGGGHHTTRFYLNGLVESAHGAVVTVYVHNGLIGSHRLRHVVETVSLRPSTRHHARRRTAGRNLSAARHHRRHHGIVAGDVVHLRGTVSGGSTRTALCATGEQVVSEHATAVVGTVVSVSGTTLLVAPEQLAVHHGDHGEGSAKLVVDVSKATVSVNGTQVAVSSLASNETVVVIGERAEGDMVAATVLGYTTTPSVVAGRLQSVNGSVLTVKGGDEAGPAQVDASGATVYLNGVAGATVSEMQKGDLVLALGTSGTNSLAATTVLDFNRMDDHPTGDNHGHQGGGNLQFAALVGTVKSVSGSTVTVTVGCGQGHTARTPSDHRPVTTVSVDASSATVLLDGNASHVGALGSGDTVVVVGQDEHASLVASALYAFDKTPAVVAGRLRTVSGTTLTLSGGTSASTTIDASSAAIYLDGTASTLAQLKACDFVVAVGPSGTPPLTATAVFAFDQHEGD